MNSLFDPNLLSDAFPDAAQANMLPPDPHVAPYEALAARFQDKQLGLGIAAQAGVSINTASTVANIINTPQSEGYGALQSTPEGQRLVSDYESVHNTATSIFGLVGEVPPGLKDPQLVEQLNRLQPLFGAMERLNLEPRLALVLEHQSYQWWQELATALEASPLNPDEPDPNNPGSTRKVLREGGLYVDSELQNNWDALTNPNGEAPRWRLHLLSGTEAPTVTSVTSYGYTDQENQTPSVELNQLLQDLGLPPIPDRTGAAGTQAAQATAPQATGRFGRRHSAPGPVPSTPLRTPTAPAPLTQPDIHPTVEAYITHQFDRVLHTDPPLDSNTWSWLDGQLPNGRLPRGYWYPDSGQVSLDWSSADRRRGALGVRPSGRGQI
jgi:hypothetical protein